MNPLKWIGRAVERLLPSSASIHYVMAKTHYQMALHSASFGSVYWFNKAKEGFDAHAKQIRDIHRTESATDGRTLKRLAAWNRHCQHMTLGLMDAGEAARSIRELLMQRDDSNAEESNEEIREQQVILRTLHRRIRRPGPR